MFCPSCGVEDRQNGQFCRACGSDLSAVRTNPRLASDAPWTAATAREEIGRAIASRIRELPTAKDLAKVAEEVLPEVEKFLENPEERRLRRIRFGTIMSAIGLGAMITFVVAAVVNDDPGFSIPAGLGLVAFLMGLAIAINGWKFTVREREPDIAEFDKMRDLISREPRSIEAAEPEARYLGPPPSVVEHTTRELRKETAAPPRSGATRE